MPEKSPAADDDTAVASVINGRYRVVRELGRGGMGRVLLVEDSARENERLALKTLLPSTSGELLTQGFRDEFAELAKRSHPNLAAAHDFGRISGTSEYFFTTEFIEGIDLGRATLHASADELLHITVQLLRGLDFLHSQGLLHNDLKPANILLERPAASSPDSSSELRKLQSAVYGDCGRVKIIDFGLISREHTSWNKILGTLRYISPERILKSTADRRSDLYSLGAVLYTVIARVPPFRQSAPRELLHAHLTEAPVPLEQHRNDLPEALRRLVARLLEKSPEDRFASAAAALDSLGRSMGKKAVGIELAHEPIAARDGGDAHLRAGALVYRDESFEVLRRAFDDVRTASAESHGLLIQGEAGVGKSRLVDEIRGHVQVSGGTHVEVAGSAVEGNLQPILETLLQSMRTSGATGLENVEAQLERKSRVHSEALSNALERFILWYAERAPLLLHFDDFHLASKVVRRFAQEIVHAADSHARATGEACRLLVVLSRRPVKRADELKISGLPTLELRDFEPAEAAGFLEHVFGQDDVPAAVLEPLVSTSRGNPLLLLELANHLVSHKWVTRATAARWEFPSSLEGMRLPESLNHVLFDKLEALDEETADVVTWLAVSGRPLAHGVLARCARPRGAALDAALERLHQAQLIAVSDEHGVVEYSLVYAGCRDVLLQRLSEGEIKQRHQRLAQNTEAEFPRWEEHADVLAEHWLLSGNETGFLRFAPRAAEMLRGRGDFETAVEYHKRLVDAMPDTAVAKKVKSLVKLSEMHEILWNLGACREDLVRIQRLGKKLIKPADQALLLRRLGCTEIAHHNHKEADALLSRAQELLGNANVFVRNAIGAARAWPLWFLAKRDAARKLLKESEEFLATARPSGEKETMLFVATANHVANLQHQLGRLASATVLYRRNLELLDASSSQARAATFCSLGTVLLEAGEYDEAFDHLRSSLEIGKEVGDRRVLCRARERLGEYFLRFGNFREALQITEVGLQDAEDLQNAGAVANSYKTLGRIYLHVNQPDEALAMFEKSTSSHARSGDVSGCEMTRVQMACYFLAHGNLTEATRLLESVRQRSQSYSLPLLEAHCAAWSAIADWKADGNYDPARFAEVVRAYEKHGYAGDLAEVKLAAAEIAIDADHLGAATDLIEELTANLKPGQPDLTCEIDLTRALLCWKKLDVRGALARLEETRRRARNQRKIGLAERCDEIERQVRAGEAAVRQRVARSSSE